MLIEGPHEPRKPWSRIWHFEHGAHDLIALVKSAWVQMLSLGFNAVQSVVLPMLIGATPFGMYAGIYTNLMVGVGIGRGPTEALVQRGRYRSESKVELIYNRRDLTKAFLFGLALAVIIFLGISAVQRWAISTALVLWLTLAVVVGASSGLRRGLMLITDRTSRLEVLDLVARPALFLAAVGLAWWIGLADGLVLWLLGASFLVTLTWPNLTAAKAVGGMATGSEPAVRPWFHLLLSNGLSILVKNCDVIILGMFVDDAMVGRYFIVARIADLAAFGYSFATARFVHRFASAAHVGDWSDARQQVARATRFGLAIAGAASIAIAAVAPVVLPLIDPQLASFQTALMILLLGQVINATLGVRGAFLTAIDPRYTLGIKLFINPLALGAMFVVVPVVGVIGAALVVASFSLLNQLTNTIVLRQLMIKGLGQPAGAKNTPPISE